MKKHIWKFAKFGGVTQLMFQTADDILQLKNLDQKLWTVLAMPTAGIFFDKDTAAVLDTDSDGFIRPPEILAAVDFLENSLNDVGLIMQQGNTLAVSEIKDKNISGYAQWFLRKLDKTEPIISLDDITVHQAEFLGEHDDNEIADTDSDSVRLQKLIYLYAKQNPALPAPELKEKLLTDAAAFSNWKLSLDQALGGLSVEQMLAAVSIFETVQKKIDDFFVRCRLLDYDDVAKEVLTNYSDVIKNFQNQELTETNELLLAMPISLPNAEKTLHINERINPAWKETIEKLYTDAVLPLAGEKRELTENDWQLITKKLSEFKSVYENQKDSPFLHVPARCLTALSAQPDTVQHNAEIALNFEKQKACAQSLYKLLLLRSHFFALLKNYVSFSDFYSGKGSIFQAGLLFFDSRSAALCFELQEDERHETLDMLSGGYLIYCDISRGTEKRKILAVLTNGDSDKVVVGRNGIFYDRDGNDWNATVFKVIANPISIREAFFSPYKNLAHIIEEQIAKKANTAAEKSGALLESATATTFKDPKEAAAGLPAKKIDLGTIALIGTAIGGISTLIGSLLQVLFGLGFWVPLGLAGILLLISGPSMILAAMKLRKRSIGPILEANGWAINAHAKVNIPLGTSLTKILILPPDARLASFDPFAEKKTGRKVLIWCLVLALIIGVFCYFYFVKKAGLNPLHWFKK